MRRFFCPSCWEEFTKDLSLCPRCKADLSALDRQSPIQKLIRALHHPDPTIQRCTVYLLGEKRGQEARGPRLDLLDGTKDYFLMEEIAEALGKIGDQETILVLTKLLDNPSFLVRGSAVRALATRGDPEIREDLERMLKDPSTYVKGLAGEALLTLKEPGRAYDREEELVQ
ncbi:MAG TPA: HEAT repeat domain-containing protein [Candidatus Limnocylindrales bacterium]|nr:HEAT repeat domain-containing protein [Candidatus Limnocylindrales bacterium]